MLSTLQTSPVVLASAFCLWAIAAGAQSFRVQCPTSTITHPSAPDTEPV